MAGEGEEASDTKDEIRVSRWSQKRDTDWTLEWKPRANMMAVIYVGTSALSEEELKSAGTRRIKAQEEVVAAGGIAAWRQESA